MNGRHTLSFIFVLVCLCSEALAQPPVRRRNRFEIMFDDFMDNMSGMANRFTSALFPDRGPQRRPPPQFAQSQGINNFAPVGDVSNDINFDSQRHSVHEDFHEGAPNAPSSSSHHGGPISSHPDDGSHRAPNLPQGTEFPQSETHFRRPFPPAREHNQQHFRRPPPSSGPGGFNLRRIFDGAVESVRNLIPINRRRKGSRSMDDVEDTQDQEST